MRVHPLDHVVEQLWGPALERSSDLRAVVDTRPDPEWRTVESYWLIPRASSARLLVPRRPRAAASGALTNYRNLRTPATNAARFALGTAARAGLPVSRSVVSVQIRRDAPDGIEQLLPVPQLSRALGVEVFAATGIRTSDNRKTMLHLVDARGVPVGYAKFGWNPPTDELVATEGDTLAEVGGIDAPMRAPRLLTRLDYHGHPVTVTEPLPLDARGSLTTVAEPTAEEMFALTPVVRQVPVRETEQLRGVRSRLSVAATAPHVHELATRALGLASAIARYAEPVPVSARWHGDLAPWNRARDGSGQLWVWDWENAERDAAAGLDALHWTFSTQRLGAADVNRMSLAACLHDADHYLTAAGLSRRARQVLAALYALTTVERACTLALHAGTWAPAFIAPDGLVHLLEQAHRTLGPGHDTGSIGITTS